MTGGVSGHYSVRPHVFISMFLVTRAHTIQESGRKKEKKLCCTDCACGRLWGPAHSCTCTYVAWPARHIMRGRHFCAQSSCTCTDCDRSSYHVLVANYGRMDAILHGVLVDFSANKGLVNLYFYFLVIFLKKFPPLAYVFRFSGDEKHRNKNVWPNYYL